MQRQVIEHEGIPVGIAISERNQFRFIAVKFHVIDLDNHRYPTIPDIYRALRSHLDGAQRQVG